MAKPHGSEGEAAVRIVNSLSDGASGRIRIRQRPGITTSPPTTVSSTSPICATSQALRRTALADGLGLTRSGEHFWVFRDHLSGLEFIRSSLELHERGLYAQLDAYSCHVFLHLREVRSDGEHPWAQLAHELGGRGVNTDGGTRNGAYGTSQATLTPWTGPEAVAKAQEYQDNQSGVIGVLDLIGASRKFSIGLLTYLERTGFTLRLGDVRKVRG